VGSGEEAQLHFPDDRSMARLHFALEWDGQVCRVRDVSGWGATLVNGIRKNQGIVLDGDRITAGSSEFVVRIAEDLAGSQLPVSSPVAPVVVAPTAPTKVQALAQPKSMPPGAPDLHSVLRGQADQLYALLDAARDPEVVKLLRESQAEYQSLYDGDKAKEMDDFAPYLVRLPGDSPLLPTLVENGWGKSWGVYLVCGLPFKEVRRHFRKFLTVKDESGKEFYFRFYDPRVLRIFLPTCTAEETKEFFGPIGQFLLENDDGGRLVHFTASTQGVMGKETLLANRGIPTP
jgi:hypothetical protein